MIKVKKKLKKSEINDLKCKENIDSEDIDSKDENTLFDSKVREEDIKVEGNESDIVNYEYEDNDDRGKDDKKKNISDVDGNNIGLHKLDKILHVKIEKQYYTEDYANTVAENLEKFFSDSGNFSDYFLVYVTSDDISLEVINLNKTK